MVVEIVLNVILAAIERCWDDVVVLCKFFEILLTALQAHLVSCRRIVMSQIIFHQSIGVSVLLSGHTFPRPVSSSFILPRINLSLKPLDGGAVVQDS